MQIKDELSLSKQFVLTREDVSIIKDTGLAETVTPK